MLLRLYHSLLVRHPLKVQAIQTGILVATGDVISQTFFDRKNENGASTYDPGRTLRFFFVGTVVGPTIHVWYKTLDKIVKFEGFKGVLARVALDQTLFAPSFLAVFLSAVNALEGKRKEEIISKLKSDYKDVLITNYQLWPMVQILNFKYVPLNFRVFVVQVVAIGWNTYLSWKCHQEVGSEGLKAA